jgi:hypothetical protein
MPARKSGRRKAGEPRLMGAKEAAAALGVGQTNLRVTAGLPEPYDVIGATTLWRAEDVVELAKHKSSRRKREAHLAAEAAIRAADTAA